MIHLKFICVLKIRFYSRNSNLDNNYSKISKMSCGILQMNIFRNLLVIFGNNFKIQVFGLEGGKDSSIYLFLLAFMNIEIQEKCDHVLSIQNNSK